MKAEKALTKTVWNDSQTSQTTSSLRKLLTEDGQTVCVS